MNYFFQANLSLVSSVAAREAIYELAVDRRPNSIRIRIQRNVTVRKK